MNRVLKECVVALVLFGLLTVVSGSATPIAVVVSGSMEPALARGDIVLMRDNAAERYRVGEIVAFVAPQRPSDSILHRVVAVSPGGDALLTKGDANALDDSTFLYEGALPASAVQGRVWAVVPWLGRPFVWILERPLLKYGLVAAEMLYTLWK